LAESVLIRKVDIDDIWLRGAVTMEETFHFFEKKRGKKNCRAFFLDQVIR
jgi:hypothetical protein